MTDLESAAARLRALAETLAGLPEAVRLVGWRLAEWDVPAEAREPYVEALDRLVEEMAALRAVAESLQESDVDAACHALREAIAAAEAAGRALRRIDHAAWETAGVRWWVEGALADPSGGRLACVLEGWSLDPHGDAGAALHHAYTRRPRGDRPAWERHLRERGSESLLFRWLPFAVIKEARRQAGTAKERLLREGESVAEPESSERPDAAAERGRAARDLQLRLAAAGLSAREQELALAVAVGSAETLSEAARGLGLVDSTGRNLAARIRKKLASSM